MVCLWLCFLSLDSCYCGIFWGKELLNIRSRIFDETVVWNLEVKFLLFYLESDNFWFFNNLFRNILEVFLGIILFRGLLEVVDR